jgi:predicted nucleotide-binding protein
MPRTPQPPSGEMSADQIRSGIAKIQRRIAELDAFDPTSIIDRKTPELTELAAKIATTIADVFSPGSVDFGRFNSAAWFDTDGRKRSSAYGSRRLNRGELQHSIAEQKDENLALLRAALTILEERLPHHEPAIAEPIEATDLCTSRRIFVVHGHDEGSKEAVARFLETLEFQPIILNEKADEGRTIIEKFEHHADVGFAVVLLTSDDQCGKKRRARQNVILELGYFAAKLGRSRVCALKRGDVELPSDILGVLFTTYDEGGAWKTRLARELEAAEYEINWNKAKRA